MNSSTTQDWLNLQSFIFRLVDMQVTYQHFPYHYIVDKYNYTLLITFNHVVVQLRNLVWATSKHDVYLMSNNSVMHWSSLSGNLSEVLNFSGHVAPTEVVELPIHKVCHFGSFQPYTKNKQVFFFFGPNKSSYV